MCKADEAPRTVRQAQNHSSRAVAMKSFGEAFRKFRKERRLTLREIGAQVGLSIGFLSDVEHGRKHPPKNAVVAKIEELLNVSTGVLRALAEEARQRKPTECNLAALLRIARLRHFGDIFDIGFLIRRKRA